MSVVVQEQGDRPFRVPGYAGYVPGLKYLFGHTYGYAESRLFKTQHPETQAESYALEKLTPYQAPLRELSSVRTVHDACIQRNGVHQKVFKVQADDVQQPSRVQWTDGTNHQSGEEGVMDIIEPEESQPLKHVSTQCTLEEALDQEEEREGLQSVATQWSDQEVNKKKRYSAATQWTPIDFAAVKTISGYTGHLPGRHYVNPGKTFCQEMDALLTTFQPKSADVLPMSRHNFTSALQQLPERKPEGLDDSYFDRRPPSTYANNYPIPGYQGFVPRVRISTSSLGIRYIKAVEKSLHALHEQQNLRHANNTEDDGANSPKKLLDKRPLHTPRHKPHPRPQLEEDDWRLVYRRPPSTYMDSSSKTFIPGYRGFVPHLRGSPNAVGIRYSKAAQRCLLKCAKKLEDTTDCPSKDEAVDPSQNITENQVNDNYEEGDRYKENDENGNIEFNANEEELDDSQDVEAHERNSVGKNRLQRQVSPQRPKQHPNHPLERKPSTYLNDARYPIPGYQGFVPRLRDSPTTLGLRYTKAALKTLEDVHRIQAQEKS